jgi:hypothetical protein
VDATSGKKTMKGKNMTKKRSPREITSWISAITFGVNAAKKGYETIRYNIGGTRVEDITVKKIVSNRTSQPRLKVGGVNLIRAEISGVPLGSGGGWIVHASNGLEYLIPKGKMNIKSLLEVGKTYRCRVFGDADWGIPKILGFENEEHEEEISY